MSDPLKPDEPTANIWAIQNISDTKHDGLNWVEAQKTVPVSANPLKEDVFLENFLYNLPDDKRGCNANIETIDSKINITTGILADYICYCYVPLVNGEESNVSASGSRRFFDKRSVLETILEKENFKFDNIYVSKDFGFPSMQYDFTYFQNKKVYMGYTPAQENDAAGKPTLISKKANEYGFFSPDINVDFIWTTVRSQTDTDKYEFPETKDKLEKTCLNYRSEIQWDTTHTGNNAHNLKSVTTFTGENAYVSNSEWTSKSDKSVVEYTHFNNSAFSLLNKSITALCSPKESALDAIQSTNFDLFHTLAKRSGDAFTAYIYDQIEGRTFVRRDKIDKTNREFVLPPCAFLYQTHDRLAAAGALSRGVGMVILEHPRDDKGNNCFSLFFKKDLCDDAALRQVFMDKYKALSESTNKIDVYSQFDEKIQKNAALFNETTVFDSLDVTIEKIKSVTLDRPPIVNDAALVEYIRNDILRNRLKEMGENANTLRKSFQEMTDANVLREIMGDYPEITEENYETVKQTTDGYVRYLKQFIDTHNQIQALNEFFEPGIEEIKRNIIEKYHESFETDAQKLKPFKTIKTFTSSFVSRISRNLNPFKIFTEKKKKFLVVLDSELVDFGFPAFWLKYIDYITEDGYRDINAVYQGFINANMNNEQMKLIQKCLSYAFKSGDFKDNLNEFADLKQTLLKQTRKESKEEEDKFELELPAKLAKKTKAKVKKEEVTKTKILDRCKNFLTNIIGEGFTGGGKLTLNKDEIVFFLKFCNLFVLFLIFTKIYQGEYGYIGQGESDAIDKSVAHINDTISGLFPQKGPNEFKPMSFDEYIAPYKDKPHDFEEIIQLIGVFNNYTIYDTLVYINADTNKYEIGKYAAFEEYLFPKITDITKNERYIHIAKEVLGVFIGNASLDVIVESALRTKMSTKKSVRNKTSTKKSVRPKMSTKKAPVRMSQRQSRLTRMPGHISSAVRNKPSVRIPSPSKQTVRRKRSRTSPASSRTLKKQRVESSDSLGSDQDSPVSEIVQTKKRQRTGSRTFKRRLDNSFRLFNPN